MILKTCKNLPQVSDAAHGPLVYLMSMRMLMLTYEHLIMTKLKCKISDTQMTVKAYGPLVYTFKSS